MASATLLTSWNPSPRKNQSRQSLARKSQAQNRARRRRLNLPSRVAKDLRAQRGKKKEYGSDLILRNTATGTERTFNDALDFTISKDAKTLVYTVSSKKEETNGVYAVTTETDTAPITLLSGKGKYQRLTWDEDNTELAFTSDKEDAEAKQPKFSVYYWNRKDPQAT